MATDTDLLGASVTANAKRVQGGPSYSDKLPRSKGAMTLEQFMARNPSARSKDTGKVKDAQKKQGKRARPKTRATARSRRGGTAVPVPKNPALDLANRVSLIIAGNPVDWMEPKSKSKGIVDDDLMDMPIEELMNQ